ncbi:MAG: type II secretion system F family protein [Candidatus Omnitrophica bacterium]|nr:type II secretion system F family protein [Candidatus Omnitrophota bacterium]
MPSYQYRARDKFGALISGVMGGESQKAVAEKLAQMGYVPTRIIESIDRPDLNRFLEAFRRVSFIDLNMFMRQLATLQKAGLPILVSLNSLKVQLANKVFKDIVEQVARDVEGGSSLSGALAKHPYVFNALYVNMIQSGEASGKLDEALERLTVFGEREEKFRMQIKTATRYPIIVVIAIVVGFIVLTTLVVPRFARIFNEFSAELPLPTRFLLGVNFAVTKFWWITILILGVVIFAFNKVINTSSGRLWWDSFKLKVPVFGPLTLKLSLSRFARITGTLMHSGVPLLKVLDLASEGTGNAIISRTIGHIKASVNEGKGMVEPMKASGMFPLSAIQMVSVGEDTGKLDEMLLHISDYYDSQVDYTTNNLAALIEPILILFLGGVVLLMAMGIFLPMWNMMSLFRK